MKRNAAFISAVLLMGVLLRPSDALSQTMADYTATPPFVSNVVTPNVLILLDKSGSMGRRADCDIPSGGAFATCPTFVETETYGGIFDSMACYVFDSANNRFDFGTTVKSVINTACGSTEWDGNFLNWVTVRRIDVVKFSLIGGSCAVNRNLDGTCPASGSPAKITIKGVDKDVFNSGDTVSTPAVPTGAGVNRANGRVPTSIQSGLGANMYFHVIGTVGSSPYNLVGRFCVDDDITPPRANNTNCTGNQLSGGSDPGSTVATPFKIQAVVNSQPKGIVQNTGSRMRFGLMEFKGNDGAYVMVPIGARQTKEWNNPTGVVKTFATNEAAMVAAVEDTNNEGNTPLGESLYEAIRYIAQVNSSLFPSQYVYPLAFSPGVALATNGVGSIGTNGGVNELTVLSGSETCPAGYIANACGRDPFFYGSESAPGQPKWVSQSALVNCCKTFIIVFTDGEPTQDLTVPSAIRDYAHAVHGTHCTGGAAVPPPGTCHNDPATPPATLLAEHKTDYSNSGSHYLDDVAYWGHTVDLRQATIPVINEPGRDIPGFQNVTVYSFFAFGNISGREILMHTAKQGGFEDRNSNNVPDNGLLPAGPCVAGGPCEYDSLNNTTGAQGPDGIPDTFFESSNANDIKQKLTATITSILKRSASGTSVSVLATSSTGEGSVYQAYFFTSDTGQNGNEIKWTGYTHGLFVDAFGNLREDTDGDRKLIYKNDKIIVTRYDNNPTSPTYQKVLVDKYVDVSPEDGKADSTTPTDIGLELKDIKPIWEAGKELALRSSATRNILTWVDTNNDGVVGAGEEMAFSTANAGTLNDYLRADASGTFTASNIIQFVRGEELSGMRTRKLEVPVGSGNYYVWKLGDPIHSTPTVVGAPQERFDVLYGDPTYSAFFQQYRNRRQVAYVGANDGMLHALNVGYYHRGDDTSTTPAVEHGWFTRNPTDNSSGKVLGEELWGFVPYQLLPQLRWLTQADYTHVYYVDLKPKVTDARIFCDGGLPAAPTSCIQGQSGVSHPGGWGTILIGGFRMGGSCGNCTTGTGAPPMTVNIGGSPRTFYSAYFVLDITNPEFDPKLLWVFSDPALGLSTSYPAVARVNPSGDPKTGSANAKFHMIVGSGPNGYDADLTTGGQLSKFYVVDLVTGPGAGNSLVTTLPAGIWNSFMGDVITLDKDLDFRADTAYAGRVIHDGTLPWRGKMYRLTMGSTAPFGGVTNPSLWGIASGPNRIPTEVLDTFTCSPKPCVGPTEMGPVVAAPTVTIDDSNKIWVFFGTGRYLSNADKVSTETQYLLGVKDSVFSGCAQTSATNCHVNDLVDVSSASVCLIGIGTCGSSTNQVTGVGGVTTLSGTGPTSMVGLVQSKDGWFTTLPTAGERAVVSPTLLGGTAFFPTFIPNSNICASTGNSNLYALFYLTGTAYSEAIIGTTASGSNQVVNRSVGLGVGLASQMSVQIGQAGSGGTGGGGGGGQGCSGGVTGYVQSSTGAVVQPCTKPSGPAWSRYVSWVNQRD